MSIGGDAIPGGADMEDKERYHAELEGKADEIRQASAVFKELGEIALAGGDTEKALSHFRTYSAINPGDMDVEAAVERLETAPEPPGEEAIETPTMAALYASQGHLDRAVEVYRRLVEASPDDEELAGKLSSLEAELEAEAAAAVKDELTGRLEALLEGFSAAAGNRAGAALSPSEGWRERSADTVREAVLSMLSPEE